MKSETGAIVIQVAFASLALIAFSALSLDYGLLWVSRHQVQNAADAGALAGALSLIFDTFGDRSDAGPAKQAAVQTATQNQVWLAPPSVTAADVTFPGPCIDAGTGGLTPPTGLSPCVRVDAYRNQARGNPLPTFFGQLVGVTAQGVRATATAEAAPANATDCAQPWAIPDRWVELNPTAAQPWSPVSVFTTAPPSDLYIAPSATAVGTGYKFISAAGDALSDDFGRVTTLTPAVATAGISPGQFVPVRFGTHTYFDSIVGCTGDLTAIGSSLTRDTSATLTTAVAGATARVNRDPAAQFNTLTRTIESSCATANPPCAAYSPRIVALPVFDVRAYELARLTGGTAIQVVNIVGFFIETVTAGSISGRLVTRAGLNVAGAPAVGHHSAFLRRAVLVR